MPLPPYFDIHVTAMRTYYFTLHDPTGKLLMTSIPYRTPHDCKNAMKELAKLSIWAEVKEEKV